MLILTYINIKIKDEILTNINKPHLHLTNTTSWMKFIYGTIRGFTTEEKLSYMDDPGVNTWIVHVAQRNTEFNEYSLFSTKRLLN